MKKPRATDVATPRQCSVARLRATEIGGNALLRRPFRGRITFGATHPGSGDPGLTSCTPSRGAYPQKTGHRGEGHGDRFALSMAPNLTRLMQMGGRAYWRAEITDIASRCPWHPTSRDSCKWEGEPTGEPRSRTSLRAVHGTQTRRKQEGEPRFSGRSPRARATDVTPCRAMPTKKITRPLRPQETLFSAPRMRLGHRFAQALDTHVRVDLRRR